ncbi:MAG: hypothetical protein M3Y71_00815 [Actinomycetota bacterium]|nr:hypothetical protein [Actinomycetota bacterium]
MPLDHARDARDDDQQHPVLTEKEDAQLRGANPPGALGQTTPPSGDLDPGWAPSDVGAQAEELIKGIGGDRRPRREDVYPYLLIRAHTPGDRGARPIWPSIPCWESPDILLVDAAYTGPFSLSQLVASPTAGRRYRVFIRIWNLGLFPAIGVFVRTWYVNPGFFGGDPTNPAYQPQPIGMVALPQLEERTKPGAMQVVELDHTWDIPSSLTGHECLMASVSCPLDDWGGALDANQDRHVGQRNLTILAGSDNAKKLIFTLGQMVTKSGMLELRHGGGAVTPLLAGVLGETKAEWGTAADIAAPPVERLRRGVPTPTGQHLLTMLATPQGWLVADSARLYDVAAQLGVVEHDGEKGGEQPFETPTGTRQVLERVLERGGLDGVERFGVVSDRDPGEALLEGLGRLWDLDGLDARDLARALVEGGPFAHLLRFSHTDPEREESGGYSLAVIG